MHAACMRRRYVMPVLMDAEKHREDMHKDYSPSDSAQPQEYIPQIKRGLDGKSTVCARQRDTELMR